MTDFGFYDFSPGINLLATPLSMNDSTKQLQWSDAENVELYGDNGIRKMGGNYTYLYFGEGTSVKAVSEYRKNDDKYLVFVYADATTAHFGYCNGETQTYTIVRSDLDKDASYHISPFAKGCIVSNGVQNSFIYIIDEKPSIMTCRLFEVSGVYPVATLFYKGRVYAFTDDEDNNSTLYFSELDDPSVWYTTDAEGNQTRNYIGNILGNGSPVRSLLDYGGSLAIHGDKQTVLLSGDPNADDSQITPFTNKGSHSKSGVLNFDNKQFFYDEGFFCLQYSSLNQVQLSAELSRIISPSFDDINEENFKHLIAVPYPSKRQVWFYLPTSSSESSECDTAWVMDRRNIKQIAWYKRKASPVVCACHFNGKIYTGTSDGKILIEDYTTTLQGEAFTGFWKSAWLKFGTLKQKSVDSGLDIGFDGTASNSVTLELRYNTDPTRVKRKTVTTPQKNKFIWGGTAPDGTVYPYSKWGDGVTIPHPKFRRTVSSIRRKNVPSIFTSLQVGFTSTNDFIINSLVFYDITLEE